MPLEVVVADLVLPEVRDVGRLRRDRGMPRRRPRRAAAESRAPHRCGCSWDVSLQGLPCLMPYAARSDTQTPGWRSYCRRATPATRAPRHCRAKDVPRGRADSAGSRAAPRVAAEAASVLSRATACPRHVYRQTRPMRGESWSRTACAGVRTRRHDAASARPGRTILSGEAGQGDARDDAVEPRLSRRAAWLAMGAVALALGADLDGPRPGGHRTSMKPTARSDPGDPDDAAAAGKAAPLHFTLKDMNGVDVKLASFKGKVILLNFWATWCGPCKAEIPVARGAAGAVRRRFGGARLLGGRHRGEAAPLRREYKINYPLLVGNGREDVQEAFGPLCGIPVSVIIDRDGRIAKKHSGIATQGPVRARNQVLL